MWEDTHYPLTQLRFFSFFSLRYVDLWHLGQIVFWVTRPTLNAADLRPFESKTGRKRNKWDGAFSCSVFPIFSVTWNYDLGLVYIPTKVPFWHFFCPMTFLQGQIYFVRRELWWMRFIWVLLRANCSVSEKKWECTPCGSPRHGPGEKLSVAQKNRLDTPLCVRSAHQDVATPLGQGVTHQWSREEAAV